MFSNFPLAVPTSITLQTYPAKLLLHASGSEVTSIYSRSAMILSSLLLLISMLMTQTVFFTQQIVSESIVKLTFNPENKNQEDLEPKHLHENQKLTSLLPFRFDYHFRQNY